MRVLSVTQAVLLGLLASAPLSAGYVVTEAGEKRHVGSLASYASHMVRDLLPRHHTEAQIAAKEAAAGASGNDNAAADSSGTTTTTTTTTGHHKHRPQQNNNKRDPHHTEAQIAAKEAAAGASGNNNAATDSSTTTTGHHRHQSQQNNNKREPHHTEAQIAAKEAAAAHSGKHNQRSPQVPPPDEFGPWDSTEDEFGSWVDKREPHHTEAQIAAKEAAANSRKHGTRAAQTPPPDEFGPWDSTEDEFGSWVDKREPHHTEAQIAAKEKAAAAKAASNQESRTHTSRGLQLTQAYRAAP